MKRLFPLALSLLLLSQSVLAAETENLKQIPFPPNTGALSTITEQTSTQEEVQVTWAHLVDGNHKLSPELLRKHYDGYLLTIQNNRKSPILLLSAEVPEKVAPELAYAQLKQSAGKAYAINAGAGLALAPLTFGLSFALAIVLTGPIGAAMANGHNKTTLRYVNEFPGKISLDTVQAGETKQLAFLVPKGMTPHLHLSAQDLESKESFALTAP